MNRQKTFLALAAFMAACSCTFARAESGGNPVSELQGLWTMQLTLPGQAPAPLLVTVTSDGNTLVTGSQPGAQTQHGVWARVGDRQIAAMAMFFLYDDKGNLTGMIKVRSLAQLADDLMHMEGPAQADILDLDGNVLSSITGITFKQTRVAFDPMK